MSIAMLTRALYDTPQLSYAERTLLMVLADHSNPDGVAWPGHARLGEIMGVGERRLSELFAALIQHGFVAVHRRGTKPSTYLLFPESDAEAEAFSVDGGIFLSRIPGEPVKSRGNPATQRPIEVGESRGNPAARVEGIPPRASAKKGTVRNQTPPESRADVAEVCELVLEHVKRMQEGTRHRPPQVTQKWREAARLLLDRDRVALDDVRRVVEWLGSPAGHRFWARNILSVPTLRQRWLRVWLECTERPTVVADTRVATAALAERLRAQGE